MAKHLWCSVFSLLYRVMHVSKMSTFQKDLFLNRIRKNHLIMLVGSVPLNNVWFSLSLGGCSCILNEE